MSRKIKTTPCDVMWCRNEYTDRKVYFKNAKIIFLCQQHSEGLK